MQCPLFLSVAGICLQVESDRPIHIGEAFTPFLAEPLEPDVRAVFRQVDALSRKPGRELHKDGGWQVCMDDAGIPVRFFYDSPESKHPYAMAAWDKAQRTICVEYLSRESCRFSKLQDCFFYLDMEQLLILRDRLWPHASCVDTPFGGILFSGPSGIGKSTQAELWCQYRNARQINGDRPILSLLGGKWTAWGAPYAGSSRCYVNDSCSVTAIVMLRQSKQCSVRRLGLREAFQAIWPGLALHSWDRDYMERASDLTMDLIEKIPVYEFSCTPDEQAVIYLEQMLRKELPV